MKLSTFLVVALVSTTLCIPTGLSASPRMSWIDPRDFSDSPLDHEELRRLRSQGIDTLLFPALSEGRVYFPTNLLPSAPNPGDLMSSIELSRGEGFQIGLYFQVFIHGGNPRDPSHLARLHPEWLSFTRNGRNLKDLFDSPPDKYPFIDGFFLDPGIPRVHDFMIALLTESLGRIEPDWIILDQVRFPFPEPAFEGTPSREQPYGYHPIPRGSFKKENGVDPLILKPEPEPREIPADIAEGELKDWGWEWDRARRVSVDDFIRDVHEMLVTEYPDTLLGAVGYPDPFIARDILFGDWAGWIERGWVENVFIPNHQSPLSTDPDLQILSPSIRERMGWAGSPPPGKGVGEFLAELPEAGNTSGWIIFKERPNGFPMDRTPAVPTTLSDEGLRETLLLAQSDEISGSQVVVDVGIPTTPLEYSAEIKALYGFNPKKPPFDQLTPAGVSEKLLDLGFNAVFGGSDSKEIREALTSAGIRRYGEYPVFVGKSYWKQDPSSRPITSEGEPFKQQSWYAPLDPHQPWLREIKREALLKRVRDEQLDGIWLDFIRFPVFWEEVPPKLIETSFSTAAITSFQESTGIVPEGSNLREMASWILVNADQEWRRFRADTILQFVREIDESLHEQSPDVLLGAFVLPWTEEEYGNAIYRIAGQDLGGFAEVVDILSPMVYSHQLGHSPGWIRERTWRLSQDSTVPIQPIVQCFDQPTPMSTHGVEESIRNGMLNPSSGVILFSQRHLESTNRWELVRRVLNEENPPITAPLPLSTP